MYYFWSLKSESEKSPVDDFQSFDWIGEQGCTETTWAQQLGSTVSQPGSKAYCKVALQVSECQQQPYVWSLINYDPLVPTNLFKCYKPIDFTLASYDCVYFSI